MSTRRNRPFPWLALTIAAASLLPGVVYLSRQLEEEAVVAGYLRDHGLAGLPLTKVTAIAVSDAVRADFQVDETRFTALRMERRPFLREDTAWLLAHKEGLCGEGTRVIVNLLDRMGFDATRLTLYDRHLQSAHTLVSVLLEGREFLIDSINSPERFHQTLYEGDVSPRDLQLIHYSANPLERRAAAAELRSDGAVAERAPALADFVLYSYEALPYGKLLDKIGLQVRVFNFYRPPDWFSALAEKPNLVLAIFSLAVAGIGDAFLLILVARWRRRRQ